MAIDYQSSFNSGELSGRMNGRSSLDVYKNGCSRLENFYVLPQGGVERRTGTEFIGTTKNNGRAKMVPFIFSSTQSYAVEIGDEYISVWNGATRIDVTSSSPYKTADLDEIDVRQRFDIMYIQHPDYPIYELRRLTTTPTFEFAELAFDYPPLLEENDTDTTITTTPDDYNAWSSVPTYSEDDIIYDDDVLYICISAGGSVNEKPNIHPGSWAPTWLDSGEDVTLTASDPIFTADSVGGYYLLRTNASVEQLSVIGAPDATGSQPQFGDWLDVSFSNWSFDSSGDWNGLVIIQRQIGTGDIENYVVIGDTRGLSGYTNFAYASPGEEAANTKVRVSTNMTYSSIYYNLRKETTDIETLVEVTGYTSTTIVTGVTLSQMGSGLQTKNWSESAFSGKAGWPRAIAFHEDRMWLTGSDTEPSTIHASVSGDYYNFNPTTDASGAIRRIPDSPELSQWLVGRKRMIMGTEGGAIVVRSVDDNALIDASNITTSSQAVFGASSIPAIEANDVVVYAERSNKKIREIVYNRDEENIRSADMNILNNEILSEGVKELFLQQQPDQIIWAIDSNGDCACLTYERVQEVIGWSRFITNGDVQSACRLPAGSSEDEVWMCVKRGTKYMIEKTKPRSDANWYVDSGATETDELAHLEGLEVRCLVDTGDGLVDDGLYTVSGGAITPTTSGTSYLIGLDYDSILRTMPIEPTLVSKLPNSRIKGAVKAVAEFYPTKGGSIREKGKTGEIFDEVEFSGEKKFNIASDWTREKVIEIKQHLPYPMTVLSLAVWTEVKGG